MTALAKKGISDSPRRMGRPRLDKTDEPVMVPVRFTPQTLARILAAAGENRRAEFIRQAVEEKLARDAATPDTTPSTLLSHRER